MFELQRFCSLNIDSNLKGNKVKVNSTTGSASASELKIWLIGGAEITVIFFCNYCTPVLIS